MDNWIEVTGPRHKMIPIRASSISCLIPMQDRLGDYTRVYCDQAFVDANESVETILGMIKEKEDGAEDNT